MSDMSDMLEEQRALDERQRQEYEYYMEMQQLEAEHHMLTHMEEMWVQQALKIEFKELISLMGGIIYKLMDYKEHFEKWLAERPESIQKLAKKFPPGEYKIKEDAPYTVTAPGCTVTLMSYLENGTVGIMIKAKDKSKDALDHEAMLCEKYKKSKQETEAIHKKDVSAVIDPKWLELVSNELEA